MSQRCVLGAVASRAYFNNRILPCTQDSRRSLRHHADAGATPPRLLVPADRVEINNFHREKAMLISAAKAAGDTKKRIMIEETTPDVLNAKGLLMFLKQSPSAAPEQVTTSTRTRSIGGAVDANVRPRAADVGTAPRGDVASAETAAPGVGAPSETAALQVLKMPPPLRPAGAAAGEVAEEGVPAPEAVAPSPDATTSSLLAAAAAVDRGPAAATIAAAARSAAAVAAAKATRFKTCIRGASAPCDATATPLEKPRRVTAAAAERLLRVASSEAEPAPRGRDGSYLPGRTPTASLARSLSPVAISLPATRCGNPNPSGGPVPVTPSTPAAAAPVNTKNSYFAVPSASTAVYRMPVVPSHPIAPQTPSAAYSSTPVGWAEASPSKNHASVPSAKAPYGPPLHSCPALPPPAPAVPVTPCTPSFARGPVELFASPLPGPLARCDAEDAAAAATAMAGMAVSAAPTERPGGGNVMGKRKEKEAFAAKRGVLGKRPKVTAI